MPSTRFLGFKMLTVCWQSLLCPTKHPNSIFGRGIGTWILQRCQLSQLMHLAGGALNQKAGWLLPPREVWFTVFGKQALKEETQQNAWFRVYLSGVLHDLSYQLLKSSLPAPHLPDKGEASSHVVIAYYSQQIITLILDSFLWKAFGNHTLSLAQMFPDIPLPACF